MWDSQTWFDISGHWLVLRSDISEHTFLVARVLVTIFITLTVELNSFFRNEEKWNWNATFHFLEIKHPCKLRYVKKTNCSSTKLHKQNKNIKWVGTNNELHVRFFFILWKQLFLLVILNNKKKDNTRFVLGDITDNCVKSTCFCV